MKIRERISSIFRRGPTIEASPRFVAAQARYEAASWGSPDRSWLPGYVQSARQDLNPGDRVEMIRKSRYFEQNNAVVQKILDLIETNVVGTGICPTPASSSDKYNKASLAWWNEWCKFSDLTSRQTFETLQAIVARTQAVDGEIFILLTFGEADPFTSRAFPRIQLVESHRVVSADIKNLRREGFVEFDGILFDGRGRPAFYIVSNDNDALSGRAPNAVAVVPADQVIHVFEPSRAGQHRGVTLFHSVLHTVHDLDDLQKYEMIAAKDGASRTNIVYTENGEIPDAGNPIGRSLKVTKSDGTIEDRQVYYEQAFGGKTVALKRGDKFEQSESLRPSAAMREFWEYLTELICKGTGISFAAVQDYRGGWSGPSLRGAITSDNRFYDVRTHTLTTSFQRIWEHVIGWANRNGEFPGIETPADWHKVTWQSPRRATVDVGRESKAIIEEVRAGLRTYRDVIGETGGDWREVLTQRATEEAFLDELAVKLKTDRARIASLDANERTINQQAAAQKKEEPVTAVLAHDPLAIGEAVNLEIAAGDNPALPKTFVWMPAGTHQISAGTMSGDTYRGSVVCDAAGAAAIQAAFNRILASGRKVYLDRNHDDGEATAWVTGFSWDPARGIMASVEWTPLGEQLLRERRYYSFSPAFYVNRETNRVAGLIAGHAAGGLVNAPAFGAAMPALIAARLGGADSPNPAPGGTPGNNTTPMKKEILIKILAALAVPHAADATEEQLTALVASNADKVASNSDVKKLQDELAAVQAKDAQNANDVITKLTAEVAAITAREKLAQKSSAEAAVKAAVAKGSIKAEDNESQTKWVNLICADASHVQLLESLPAVTASAPGVVSNVHQTAHRNIVVKPMPFDAIRAMMKETDSNKRGQIYCRELREFVAVTAQLAEILAANAFGTVTSDLIILRSLDLLKLNFPVLGRISTDFSAGTVPLQGQAIKSRIVSVPTVQTYHNTNGWTSSDVTTTDVSVTIGQPVGVQIELTTTESAGSKRDLFAEQTEAAHYALGKNMVDALYAIITQGNFSGAAKRTIKALASFARADVIDMGTALGKRGVGLDRTLLLNSDYYGALSKDLVTIGNASLVDKSVLEERTLPKIHNFSAIEASNLPANAFTSTTGTLQGFGCTKDALVIATRVPEDYTRALPGAAHGHVSVVTNPDTGISVQKVDFVDHKLARAYSRIAMSYGVAVGNANSGQCLTET